MAIAKSKSALISFLGVARSTFYLWEKLPGAPTTLDEESWEAFVASMDGSKEGVESYASARRRKMIAAADRAEAEVEIAKGNLIPLEKVSRSIAAIAAVAKAKLLCLDGELPPLLVGLEPEDMQPIIRKKIDGILFELYENKEAYRTADKEANNG